MEGKMTVNSFRPKKVRVRGKGQFTIPAEYRDRIGIEEDTVLEVYHFGKVMIATPEKSVVKELAQRVNEGMGEYKVDINELLADLREGKHEYIKEG
ncbi:AbrB/MazE/SpoVT family DNA-binding domain-containing protein [Desulfotomaculum sp. 1211_IL3151]|uniref:AbrB/MazE/SpoVT family DNA-binding domain-containing protein n=1 Tax=Desulfotomaculum sp. 1211_IL3151 TaxID=3084055 RepID=UPI002FD9A1E8